MITLPRVFLATALLALASQPAASDTFVRMASGPSGGSWYPLGAKIMQVFDDEIEGITTSNTSGGGIANIKSVQGGDAEIGWSYAHTSYNGFVGKGKFDEAQDKIRHFATLYPAMFQVAVPADSPIQNFEDMKDKNISPGKAQWTGTAFAESILKAYGYGFDDIKARTAARCTMSATPSPSP